MIMVKKLNMIREIDERDLKMWTEKGYKTYSQTKSEYSNILPKGLLKEENVEEQEEFIKEPKKSYK